MTDFDPNSSAAEGSGIFGLPYSESESKLIIIPVPWDATTSCISGTSKAPEAVLEASKYVELFDSIFKSSYKEGIHMPNAMVEIEKINKQAHETLKASKEGSVEEINHLCEQLNEIVEIEVSKYLKKKKKVGLIGGDHSIAFGSIKAHYNMYPNLSVLQIDAHADLRNAFEGFTYSHASVFYNVIEKLKIKSLTQVGVRGYCEEEHEKIKNSKNITTFFQSEIDGHLSAGKTFDDICDNIIKSLDSEVYISFDIDGLSPDNCPNTGTPVPGGLTYNQAVSLIRKIHESGKKVVGFDLVEIRSNQEKDFTDIDYVIGAHLLYQLCGYILMD